ncbi:MAG: 30S ribosomal protein S21 [Candidatus Marinimicrobia bacterium]|nr:30S ribosomal protein S21 [Candidatus Neomarinimicrobiota bacterium]MBL7023673.1 30S ribosomal protein S21 [Candidatus Neomarinimicrobiota bacterium]MBL7109836.1 30S ribosomal protein S21 [Candidatus Neomarinimicrobiota bacterium]
MVKVTIRSNEPFERALKRFKKKWEKAGILRDVRAKQHYLKPSLERKMAKQKPRKRS